MAKGLDGADTLLWIVDEDFLEQVDEQLVEGGVLRNDLVEHLHRLDVLLRGAGRVGVGVVEAAAALLEEVHCLVVLLRLHLADNVPVDLRANHRFHHAQMLKIVVGLEQGITSVELDQDTTDAPDVAREAPAQVENDLWSTVVASRDDRRMILVVKGGGAEVNEANLRIEKHLTMTRGALIVL